MSAPYTSASVQYPCDRCGVTMAHSDHPEHKQTHHAQIGFAAHGTPVKRTYYETNTGNNKIGFNPSYSGRHRG